VVIAIVALSSSRAHAQACCAGTGALTPGRLALHEDALVGATVRAATVVGSFDPGGHYAWSPAHTSEYDFEEDIFGAVRVLERGQIALIVPLVETRRGTPTASEMGGGIGDVNASVRYDFYDAGRSRYLPGIAALAGVTFPTGTPTESAMKPLATDATGVGALQANAGIAIEQLYGHWLFNVTGLAAKRASRTAQGVDETLGMQLTLLAGTAYTFESQTALALSASYSYEGDATIAGVDTPGTARKTTLVAISAVVPLSDAWRVQGSASINPPIAGISQNLPETTAGLSFTAVRSW
jgi:hypothetical protein